MAQPKAAPQASVTARARRVLLIGIGSTGDVQPMVALGCALARRGHSVSVCAFEALRPLVEDAGLCFLPLPGNAQDYIGSIMKPGASPLTFLRRLEAVLGEVASALFDALYEACAGAEVVVTSFFGCTVYAIAEGLGVPVLQAHYYPMDNTGDCCIPVLPFLSLGRTVNRLSYRLAYRMIGALERRYAHPWCRGKSLPLRPTGTSPDYRVDGQNIPVLYAISPAVMPRPREWGENIRLTGFWREEPHPFEPPEDLVRFLQAGEKPIYIGFGSMTAGTGAQLLRTTLQSLAALRLRAVLAAGWGDIPMGDLPENVYVMRGFVPHAWLFARVRAAVHHGGAGTTAASLGAGIPTLAVPFGGDQYFWGARIHALDCGPKPLPRTRLNARRFTKRLRELTQTPTYAAHAQAVARAMQAERGAQEAADFVEAALESAPVHKAARR